MNVLLLSCSTGEGHNHCAMAVREALARRGHQTVFLDMLHTFGEPGPLSIETVLNTISTKTPDVFGLVYKAGEMVSAVKTPSPVYLMNSRHARELRALIVRRGYDAVVCSHLFPMETLTYLRRHDSLPVRCYGILSDYACIPFLSETELDGYMLPHADVRDACLKAGMPGEKLTVTGMPVSDAFRHRLDKAKAREHLGLPLEKKIYLIMTGGIGCGDALGLCGAILKLPSDDALLCVLAGRNQTLLDAIKARYGNDGQVMGVPFTDQVAAYMSAADVLLSKPGGISSSEAVVLNVPLVLTMAIPGVETLNAAFFARRGLAYFAQNEDEAARCADRLIYDESAAQKMLAAQKRGIPDDGAERIAEQIEKDFETRKV